MDQPLVCIYKEPQKLQTSKTALAARGTTAFFFALLLSGPDVSAMIPDRAPFTITIKPITDGNGKVASVEVNEVVEGGAADSGLLSFRAVISAITVKHIADGIKDLSFTDAAGPVLYKTSDDGPSDGSFPYRHWRFARAIKHPLAVRYRMPLQNGASRGGPPFALVSAGAGFAGSGFALLMLPENIDANRTRIRWDLSMLPKGSIGSFTAGLGDVTLDRPPSEIASQWVLAGPAMTNTSARTKGFHIYILGEPPFSRAGLAAFGQRTYDALTKRLNWFGHPDYRLMVRARDGKSFTTGTAAMDFSAGALVTTGTEYDDSQGYDHLVNTVFHEMTHFWVGELSDGGNWFSEGLTVYLTATIPCEAGLVEPSVCASDLNLFLRNYNASPARFWSQARIEGSGFTDEKIRQVPYARGALFFADLNSRIKARSHGHHSLIDALRPLMLARAKGKPFTVASFEGMLSAELGSQAVAEFRAKIIDGTMPIEPAFDAFGHCLTRRIDGSSKGFVWEPAVSSRARGCKRPRT